MINWYFCIKSKIYKVLFTFIYFRLIHIKTNIFICLPITKLNPKNKKIYFIKKTACIESNSPVERSVKDSEYSGRCSVGTGKDGKIVEALQLA
ncbi:hypothetical protein OKW24_003986 [Peribacillus simplex]|nr:hypothetical protein [Peribacillus simplex]